MYAFRNPNKNDELPEPDAQAAISPDEERDPWEPEDLAEAEAEAEVEEADAGDNEPVEDSIQLYLHEIGQVALLTASEERDLAIQITEGKAARLRIEDEDYVDGRERALLELRTARGLEARRKLIQANLRLVVSVAKKYIGSPMAFMDLVQEGNIGLMRAVEKFDYTRGNRFSTYATWWIRQAVTRSIAEQSRLIRLPVHLSESLVHLRRAIYKLEQQLEREPSAQEIAHTMGMSLRKV
ncbi:MAG: sigma-70 family RNA polymerase sigma factor, partial [Oscillochloris sp.]|nr:sigma-70 family RNA polymerase sigma factor [Oscillochloris sp.]